MLRFLLIALVGSLLLPAAASATTLVSGAGQSRPQPYQGWVDQSSVPTPGGVVTLELSDCPVGPAWASACVLLDEAPTVHLGAMGRDRATLLHELGHVFDEQVMTAADRTRFTSLLGLRGTWHGDSAGDPPHEQFAEAYAFCARTARLRSTRLGMYGYVATPGRQRAVCGLIRDAAARRPA